MKDFSIYTLPNGISVIHQQVPNTKVVHCGFALDVGSRDETAAQQGIAHFWEHMVFKGTRKRKAHHILSRIDSVGGELNAYTTKEKIFFYASVLDQYFENAFELLTDITFSSIFPEKQIERERNVILEEMAMYNDNPEEAIQDDFDDIVFSGHPLGKNILGTRDSINKFQRDHFNEFIYQNLNTEKLIFSCIGNIRYQEVARLADKYLKDIPPITNTRERQPFWGYKPKQKSVTRQLHQAQCAIGRDAYGIKDEKRLAFGLLTNILGGPAMNSRLNMALREKQGYVYSIEADYHAFTDIGLFAVFFGTDVAYLEKSINWVHKELKKLREKPLGTLQLHKAKEQLMGQLAINNEQNQALMLMRAKNLLDTGEIESLDSIFKKIQQITAGELQDVAREMFAEDQLSVLTFEPENI